MDTFNILSQLRGERDLIDAAIDALENLESPAPAKPARVAPTPIRGPRLWTQPPVYTAKGRPRMSVDARKRISEAAKRRWAERRNRAA